MVGFVGGQTALTLTLEADSIVLPVIRVALASPIAFEEHLSTLSIDGVDLSGYQAVSRGNLPEELTCRGVAVVVPVARAFAPPEQLSSTWQETIA